MEGFVPEGVEEGRPSVLGPRSQPAHMSSPMSSTRNRLAGATTVMLVEGTKSPSPSPLPRGGEGDATLRIEVLNLGRFDADAERNVVTVAEHFNLRGNADAIPFSQGLD